MGLNSSLSSPTSDRSVKKGGGGNVDIARVTRLLVTDHGLKGFPDLKVDPGLEKILLVLFMSP